MMALTPDNATVSTTSIGGAMVSRTRSRSSMLGAGSSLSHGATRSISSITGSATPGSAVVGSPSSLASEDCVVETIEGGGTGAVDEGSVANKGNVVEAVIPESSVRHAVCAQGHDGSNDSSCEDLIWG
jgi:hypothetical protein